MSVMFRFSQFSLLVLAVGGLLAGCITSPTPYQAADGRYGYISENVGEDTVRVSFRGNAKTSEDDVRQSLLRRMVEIAEERGAGSFTILESEKGCVTTLRTSPSTTCTYRQSGDAMFPYQFGVYEIGSWWHATPQREYEATATIQLFEDTSCGGAPNCQVTREARAKLDTD